MSYYKDKIIPHDREATVDSYNRAWNEMAGEVNFLMGELDKACRQVDRLERKLLLRSKKLGEARADTRAAEAAALDALVAGIPAGYDFAGNQHERELEFQLSEAEREIDYLRRDEEDARW